MSVLDDVLEKLELEEPFLIKIDVQGFEEQVLLGSKNTLPKAIAVVVEVSALPMYEGEPGFDRIYEMMKAHGFAYCGNVDQWRSSKDGSILQFDCLFENRRFQQTAPQISTSALGNLSVRRSAADPAVQE